MAAGEEPEEVERAGARTDGRSFAVIVKGVNRALRGWYGYFQHSQANGFASVDGCVRVGGGAPPLAP